MNFKEQVETLIGKKLKRSQVLLLISVLIASGVAYAGYRFGTSYYIWAMYFVIIGALTLPNINNCKKDLLDYKNNEISFTEGEVLDIFPEKNEEGKWIVFMKVDGKKGIHEFVFPSKPTIVQNNHVKVMHTNIFKLPVRVETVNDVENFEKEAELA